MFAVVLRNPREVKNMFAVVFQNPREVWEFFNKTKNIRILSVF